MGLDTIHMQSSPSNMRFRDSALWVTFGPNLLLANPANQNSMKAHSHGLFPSALRRHHQTHEAADLALQKQHELNESEP